MGSWPFLIYMIDVLTTDGAYGGWVALLLFSTVVYSILWFLKTDSSTSPFFLGQNLTLNQDWAKFKAGDVLIVEELHENKLVKVKYPNGVSSGWLKVNAMQRVSANKGDVKDEKPTIPVDITRGPRKISGFFMIICIIGILSCTLCGAGHEDLCMTGSYHAALFRHKLPTSHSFLASKYFSK